MGASSAAIWFLGGGAPAGRARRRAALGRARAALVGALVVATPATALADSEVMLRRGTWVFALEAGAGSQVLGGDDRSNVAFVSLSPRLSMLPLDAFGPDWLRGNVELGVEGWFQHYTHPGRALAAGLKLAARYHVLRWRRWVPYLEATAGVGGTSLNVGEIDSNFTFVLEGGAGVAYVVERQAVAVGVRFFHVSNGDLATPNTGVNAVAGRLGISVFFP
jgi:hypothetical protein